jgi:hypothetical protein
MMGTNDAGIEPPDSEDHAAGSAWHSVSSPFFNIAVPVILAVLFFGVLTPVGLIMRAAGRDTLRLRFDRGSSSYWLARVSQASARSSMTNQF